MRFVAQKRSSNRTCRRSIASLTELIGCRRQLGNQIHGLLAKYGIILPLRLSQIRMHLPGIVL
jgi:hypothetical protein